ncbi:hypothetical protein BV25DRAFT_1826145 [Artomyces pyxidatus]|uniref:Uncharacterized protein n=1 Tax=Artomyces pyxidatus TaxID=48021 RepID=A0ACB8T180_9AGAM|nr:hypothetical protein BV25DRAFT_1826145 [Artomyces pyxidatus]
MPRVKQTARKSAGTKDPRKIRNKSSSRGSHQLAGSSTSVPSYSDSMLPLATRQTSTSGPAASSPKIEPILAGSPRSPAQNFLAPQPTRTSSGTARRTKQTARKSAGMKYPPTRKRQASNTESDEIANQPAQSLHVFDRDHQDSPSVGLQPYGRGPATTSIPRTKQTARKKTGGNPPYAWDA